MVEDSTDERSPEHLGWIGSDLVKAVSAAPPELDLRIQVYITGAAKSPSFSRSDSGSDSGTPSTLVSQTSIDQRSVASTTKDEKSFACADTKERIMDFDMKGVSVYAGRPNVREILEDAVTTSSGPVSVDGESHLKVLSMRVTELCLICSFRS